jgi:hypothetical protein
LSRQSTWATGRHLRVEWVADLLGEKEEGDEGDDMPLEERRGYAAFAQFCQAATKFAGTSLAELKEEGLKTSLTDGESAIPAQKLRLMCVGRRGRVWNLLRMRTFVSDCSLHLPL